MVCGSMSPWWAPMAWQTLCDSRYLRASCSLICACEPSTSWSIALPMSCSSPARRATLGLAPSSEAMMPARWATSMEWFSTFCP